MSKGKCNIKERGCCVKGRIVSWLLVTVFFFVVAQDSSATNGILRDGIGAKSQGMGGTYTAVADDAVGAIYHNPAGIGFAQSNIFDIGLSFVNGQAHFQNPNNDQGMEGDILIVPDFGLVVKPEDSNFTWGIGVITAAGVSGEWILNDTAGPAAVGAPNYGQGIENKILIGLTKIAPTLAYQVSPELSIGASFGPAQQLYEMEGFFTFQTHPVFSNYTALADMEMSGWGWTGNLGVLYKVNEKLNLGLSYTSETRVDLEGDVDLDLSAQLAAVGLGALVPTAHYDIQTGFTFPQTVNLGAAYQATSKLLVALDVGWIDWSQAFDELFLNLKNGDNAGVNAVLGSTAVDDTLPLKWEDRVVLHCGLEYQLSEQTTLRFGYSFGKSPVPDDTLMPLVSTISEQAITLGYGHKMESWELNIAYQYDFPHKQSTGTSRMLGLDFNNSSVEVSQHWIGVTLSKRY